MATAYATVDDVKARITRVLTADEEDLCKTLLEDAAVIIDSASPTATADAKKVVSCRMVVRALGDGQSSGVPIGASQGTLSALGYSQSWTMGSGSTGELYLGKLDKQLLGMGNRIGCTSPVEAFANNTEVNA